jgi:hypothetical protein
LSGCGQAAGRAIAAQACQKVYASLRLFSESKTAPSLEARPLRERAVIDLEDAEPLAAIAAGEDTEWQALSATLSEAGQVPERYLVGALRAQCASPTGDG